MRTPTGRRCPRVGPAGAATSGSWRSCRGCSTRGPQTVAAARRGRIGGGPPSPSSTRGSGTAAAGASPLARPRAPPKAGAACAGASWDQAPWTTPGAGRGILEGASIRGMGVTPWAPGRAPRVYPGQAQGLHPQVLVVAPVVVGVLAQGRVVGGKGVP